MFILASIRIIDPTRTVARDAEEEEDDIMNTLGIRQREKRPIKRVKINESANQIQGISLDTDTIASFEIPKGDITSTDRFV